MVGAVWLMPGTQRGLRMRIELKSEYKIVGTRVSPSGAGGCDGWPILAWHLCSHIGDMDVRGAEPPLQPRQEEKLEAAQRHEGSPGMG